MSMDHNGGNQNLPSPTLCRMGCGFYGNATFEGMCSKCYKDALKRRQQSTSPTQLAGRVSPSIGTSLASVDLSSNSGSSSLVETSSAAITAASVSLPLSTTSSRLDTSTTPSVETATPTVPSASNPDKTSSQDKEEAVASGAEASPADKDKESSDKDKKPKKNRCHTCKKKVGLTGFECRCGGMYCSLHRYSDKHDCTFNYKEMAQQQIRKNNPVVVGQKIQKI